MFAEIVWGPREPPLAPAAVAARGAARRQLIRRLLEMENFAGLHGVDGGGWLVITGPEQSLPWADGVIYLGRDLVAAELFLPTHSAPRVPLALFAAAISRRAERAGARTPLVVLPGDNGLVSHTRPSHGARIVPAGTSSAPEAQAIISLAPARAIDRSLLVQL